MGKVIVRRRPPNVVGVDPGVLAWQGVDPTPIYLPVAKVDAASVLWQGVDPTGAAYASSDVGAIAWQGADPRGAACASSDVGALAWQGVDPTGHQPPPLEQILGARAVRYWSNAYAGGVWTDEINGVTTSQPITNQRPSATTTPAGSTAVSFDGADDFLLIDTGPAFLGSPNRALVFGIFKVSNTLATNRALARLRSIAGDGDGVLIAISPISGARVAVTAWGGSANAQVVAYANSPTDTGWHTLVVKFDANRTITLYIDGVAQTATGTVGGTTDVMTTFVAGLATFNGGGRGYFGADPSSGYGQFPGILAHWGVAVDSTNDFSPQDVSNVHTWLASLI